jgi:hypothetical protein
MSISNRKIGAMIAIIRLRHELPEAWASTRGAANNDSGKGAGVLEGLGDDL